jgi:hypothetical protein
MVGHRQKNAIPHEDGDMPPAKKSKSLASKFAVASVLATCILLKWAWGALSSADCQELAMAAKLSGNEEEEIDIIASTGAYGQNPGSINRDLMKKFCKDMETPKPRTIRIPFKDRKDPSKSINYTEAKIFLPSDWLVALACSDNMSADFSALFGVDSLEEWWSQQSAQNPKFRNHPLLKKKNYKQKGIPVMFHGDGAAYMHNDSLMTVSFNGVLKEGSVVETNLFLASWPKSNAAVSASEGTWDTIWTWIVWDLNQLFHNRYDDKDPWGNPLPEDMAEKAGKPILPDDYFIVTWGVQGDMDFFQNDLGCPYHSCVEPKACCNMCNCKKKGPYHWFNWKGPWIKSRSDRHQAVHPVNKIIGWTQYHFMLDWLHVVDLGIASHACGNILFQVVFHKLKKSTRAAATCRVAEFLASHKVEQGSELDSLELKNFSNIKSPHQEYPQMHFLKAAQVRGLVHKVAMLFESFVSNSTEDKHMLRMIQSLDVAYETMHNAGVVFTADEYRQFKKASLDFLDAYMWLHENVAGKTFNIVPKFHYFFTWSSRQNF